MLILETESHAKWLTLTVGDCMQTVCPDTKLPIHNAQLTILSQFVCLFDGVNITFNNISVISWRSILLVEETGGPGENHRPVSSH